MSVLRLLAPLGVVLTACTSNVPAASVPSAVSVPPAAATAGPSPSPESAPSSAAPSTRATPAGADAAPEAAIIDASGTAATNYRAWLDYELNSDGDRLRNFETEAYPDGVFVCARLASGTAVAVIESTLSGTKGWSGTGAAAIIKGAVNALCPQFNQGYQTYFDRTVASATTALAGALPWSHGPPPFYEIGYFMKASCAYLSTTGSAIGLEAHLHSFRVGGPNQSTSAAAFVQRVLDDQLLRRATHHAVFAGCLGDHYKLNGYWTMA